MDRFALQFSLGYVTPEEEVAIPTDQTKHHPLDDIRPCVSKEPGSQLVLVGIVISAAIGIND